MFLVMKKRKRVVTKEPDLQKGDAILTVLFFTSVGLLVWAINIYRMTIIETKYLFSIVLFGILFAIAVLSWAVKSSYSTFWTVLIKSGIGGGLFYFFFLFLNQQFAETNIQTEQFLIIEKGTLARGTKSTCGQPFVYIDFYGIEKQLVFNCRFTESVRASNKVKLTFSNGGLGFTILRSKQLLQ